MNVTIRRHLWQILFWPRLTITWGVWPKGRPMPKDVVFRYWIIGPIEVRQFELPETR